MANQYVVQAQDVPLWIAQERVRRNNTAISNSNANANATWGTNKLKVFTQIGINDGEHDGTDYMYNGDPNPNWMKGLICINDGNMNQHDPPPGVQITGGNEDGVLNYMFKPFVNNHDDDGIKYISGGQQTQIGTNLTNNQILNIGTIPRPQHSNNTIKDVYNTYFIGPGVTGTEFNANVINDPRNKDIYLNNIAWGIKNALADSGLDSLPKYLYVDAGNLTKYSDDSSSLLSVITGYKIANDAYIKSWGVVNSRAQITDPANKPSMSSGSGLGGSVNLGKGFNLNQDKYVKYYDEIPDAPNALAASYTYNGLPGCGHWAGNISWEGTLCSKYRLDQEMPSADEASLRISNEDGNGLVIEVRYTEKTSARGGDDKATILDGILPGSHALSKRAGDLLQAHQQYKNFRAREYPGNTIQNFLGTEISFLVTHDKILKAQALSIGVPALIFTRTETGRPTAANANLNPPPPHKPIGIELYVNKKILSTKVQVISIGHEIIKTIKKLRLMRPLISGALEVSLDSYIITFFKNVKALTFFRATKTRPPVAGQTIPIDQVQLGNDPTMFGQIFNLAYTTRQSLSPLYYHKHRIDMTPDNIAYFGEKYRIVLDTILKIDSYSVFYNLIEINFFNILDDAVKYIDDDFWDAYTNMQQQIEIKLQEIAPPDPNNVGLALPSIGDYTNKPNNDEIYKTLKKNWSLALKDVQSQITVINGKLTRIEKEPIIVGSMHLPDSSVAEKFNPFEVKRGFSIFSTIKELLKINDFVKILDAKTYYNNLLNNLENRLGIFKMSNPRAMQIFKELSTIVENLNQIFSQGDYIKIFSHNAAVRTNLKTRLGIPQNTKCGELRGLRTIDWQGNGAATHPTDARLQPPQHVITNHPHVKDQYKGSLFCRILKGWSDKTRPANIPLDCTNAANIPECFRYIVNGRIQRATSTSTLKIRIHKNINDIRKAFKYTFDDTYANWQAQPHQNLPPWGQVMSGGTKVSQQTHNQALLKAISDQVACIDLIGNNINYYEKLLMCDGRLEKNAYDAFMTVHKASLDAQINLDSAPNGITRFEALCTGTNLIWMNVFQAMLTQVVQTMNLPWIESGFAAKLEAMKKLLLYNTGEETNNDGNVIDDHPGGNVEDGHLTGFASTHDFSVQGANKTKEAKNQGLTDAAFAASIAGRTAYQARVVQELNDNIAGFLTEMTAAPPQPPPAVQPTRIIIRLLYYLRYVVVNRINQNLKNDFDGKKTSKIQAINSGNYPPNWAVVQLANLQNQKPIMGINHYYNSVTRKRRITNPNTVRYIYNRSNVFEYNQENYVVNHYDTYLFTYATTIFGTPQAAINYINEKSIFEDVEADRESLLQGGQGVAAVAPQQVAAPIPAYRELIKSCDSLSCNNYAYFYKLINNLKPELNYFTCWMPRVADQNSLAQNAFIPSDQQQSVRLDGDEQAAGKIIKWISNPDNPQRPFARVQRWSGTPIWSSFNIHSINGNRYCGFNMLQPQPTPEWLMRKSLVYRSIYNTILDDKMKAKLQGQVQRAFADRLVSSRDPNIHAADIQSFNNNYWERMQALFSTDIGNAADMDLDTIRNAIITTKNIKDMQVNNLTTAFETVFPIREAVAKRSRLSFGGLRKKTKRRRRKKKKTRRKNKRRKKTKRRRKKRKKTRRKR